LTKKFMKPNNSLNFLKYLEPMICCIWYFKIFKIEYSLNLIFFQIPKINGYYKNQTPTPHWSICSWEGWQEDGVDYIITKKNQTILLQHTIQQYRDEFCNIKVFITKRMDGIIWSSQIWSLEQLYPY
jgi:hypothetical protein